MEVPAEAYYGAQTHVRREISDQLVAILSRFHPGAGLIKKASAQVNMDLGLLSRELGAL